MASTRTGFHVVSLCAWVPLRAGRRSFCADLGLLAVDVSTEGGVCSVEDIPVYATRVRASLEVLRGLQAVVIVHGHAVPDTAIDNPTSWKVRNEDILGGMGFRAVTVGVGLRFIAQGCRGPLLARIGLVPQGHGQQHFRRGFREGL